MLIKSSNISVYEYLTRGTYTFTQPSGAKVIHTLIYSAGHGGGSGRRGAISTANCGGGGGTAGNGVEMYFLADELPSSFHIGVGSGGIGGAGISGSGNGNSGGLGGSSYISDTSGNLIIKPGIGNSSFGGFSAGTFGGGTNTSTSTFMQTTFHLGGNGGTTNISMVQIPPNDTGGAPTGGGAGGAISNTNTYVAATAGGSINGLTGPGPVAGGALGASGVNGGDGVNPSYPHFPGTGGGGGGASTTGNGGNGGNGGRAAGGGGGGGVIDTAGISGSGGNGGDGFAIITVYF